LDEKKEKILIVDDEKSNLYILTEILHEKFTIVVAKCGQKAIELAFAHQPDLVLLDIMLPDIDGFQVLKSFKNSDSLKDVPVIFISALNDVENEEKGLSLGAVDYIIKPFSPTIVRARVNTHLKIARQRKMIETLAMLDGLTEIPNRRSYQIRLEDEWLRAERTASSLTLATLDIDFFKQFNDNYGHSDGDEALKAVAKTMINSLKRAADFAARTGGEEFAIIIPENSAEGAFLLLNDLCRNIKELKIPHEFSTVDKFLTVSVGGVTCMPHKKNITKQELIEAADSLLYKAKSNGRNTVEWADKTIYDD
jgi:diguanylate cyclase (GGDEF)-like protein